VERIVAADADPARAALAALLAGPTAGERAEGLSQVTVAGGDVIYSVRVTGRDVAVDFTGLLDADPALATWCAGSTFREAVAAALAGFATVILRLDGTVEAFDAAVGVRCDVPPDIPADDGVLVYLHCPADLTPLPRVRPADPGGDLAGRLQAAIDALIAGPTEEEAAAGLYGAVTEAAAHVDASVSVTGDIAVIDFAPTGNPVGNYSTSTGSRIYVGELVATAFQFSELEEVEFTEGGDCGAFAGRFEAECRTFTRRDATTSLLSAADWDAVNSMTNDLADLLAIGPRVAGTSPEHDAADWIEQRLSGIGVTVDRVPVPLPTGNETRNLTARFGDGPVEVLLGAHYDSVEVSPGIDDNGSGVAVLLELAARLHRTPVPGLTVTLAFFGGEEVLPGYGKNDHHYGSRQMAAAMQQAGTLPDLMVSVDMVGVGGRLLAVTYEDTDPAAARALAAAGDAVGVPVTTLSRGDISDHEAFARAGVPAAFLWRPDNPAWHTSRDDTADVLLLLLEDLRVIEAFLAAAGA
jgi:hypothetical protein